MTLSCSCLRQIMYSSRTTASGICLYLANAEKQAHQYIHDKMQEAKPLQGNLTLRQSHRLFRLELSVCLAGLMP